MRRLLNEFDEIFDLGRRIFDTTLGELVESGIDKIDAQVLPDWGAPGLRDRYLSESGRDVDFYYAPHLFPGMDEHLRLAHQLQFHMLPRDVPSGAPVSIAAVLESFCHLSGDLFGWEMLADGRFLIWIVDLSGHGVRAGLASAMLKVLIDNLRERHRVGSLAAELNDTFLGSLRDPAGRLFATGLFLVLSGDGSACYTSAGHPPALLRRNGGRIEELGSTALPIGMFPGQEYPTVEIRLQPGDTLLLYTDGLIESSDAQGEFFGLPRVRRILQDEFDRPRSLTHGLYNRIADFQDMDRLEDDVTFLAARFSTE